METKTLPCKTCGKPSTATGLQTKALPPTYQYQCEAGHMFWVKAIKAEVEPFPY